MKSYTGNKATIVAITLCIVLIATPLSSGIGAEEHTVIPTFGEKALNAPYHFEEQCIASVDSAVLDTAPDFVPGELIVKLKKHVVSIPATESETSFVKAGVCSLDRLNDQFKVMDTEKVFKVNDESRLSCFYKLSLPEDSDVLLVAERYLHDDHVEYAGPNYIMTADLTPNDPCYSSYGSWGQDYFDLYGMHIINASGAWDVTNGSHDVVVAVIDSGVDYSHGDLAGNMWINDDETPDNGVDDDNDGFVDNIYGADFAYNDGDPWDGGGHGTHCAGTIAAVGNNSVGIVGVNWQTKIMAVKALCDCGSGTIDDLAAALQWAADQGAHVLSNSWGSDSRLPYEPTLAAAVQYAYEKGCVIVFSAGNNDDYVRYYCPQNMEETIAVAATDYQDQKAWFSNGGEKVDVSAPGVDILSLRAQGTGFGYDFPGDITYSRADGTSMACPHVAGLAALLLDVKPSCSNYMVKERIKATADNIDVLNPGYEGLLGSGRINASRAVQRSEQTHNIDVKTLDVPSHVKFNEPLYVKTTIINDGDNDETDVLVKLLVDGLEIDNVTLPLFEFWTGVDLNFTWVPAEAGVYTVAINVTVPGVTEETYVDNERSQVVRIGVWNLDSDELFNTIQNAVNDSDTSDGHRILVPTGTYYENVMSTKGIVLMGADRDLTVIDGGSFNCTIHIHNTDDMNITDLTIRNGTYGVSIESSTNITISNTLLSNNTVAGICLQSSNHVTTINNEIVDNLCGVKVTDLSTNNTITDNAIFGNQYGFIIDSDSNYNLIYNNNFNNTQNALDAGSNNRWDNGYRGFLSGGNYWSDYNGSDEFSGPDQDDPGVDGIGDTPYDILGGSNLDRYPLMYPTDVLVINLNNTEGFQTIQSAIDDNDTLNGHTIFVRRNNIYYETIRIPKSINLIGENRNDTIIDANSVDDVIAVLADNVTITGFTLQNSGGHCGASGIDIYSNSNHIKGNNIFYHSHGISLFSSGTNNTLSGNTISNTGRGIYFGSSCNTNIISDNNISNNTEAIWMQSLCDHNTILRNTISYNAYYADYDIFSILMVYPCNNNTLVENTITRNSAGLQIGGSNNNISRNNISYNFFYNMRGFCSNSIISGNDIQSIELWEGSNNRIIGNTFFSSLSHLALFDSCSNNIIIENTLGSIQLLWDCNGNSITGNMVSGISLWRWCNNSIISENTIEDSRYGIYLSEWCTNSIIANNMIKNNGQYGIYLAQASDNNCIYHNNFITNAQHAYDKCNNIWYNQTLQEGNYWDDFDEPSEGAYDNNSNGIVDAPYEIPNGGNQDLYPFMNHNGWLNHPPETPAEPSGPGAGRTNKIYTYTTSTNDPGDDLLYYMWDWGNGDTSAWLGPYSSGENVSVSHMWTTPGTYQVRVKAKDSFGVASPWSDPLTMKIRSIKEGKMPPGPPSP